MANLVTKIIKESAFNVDSKAHKAYTVAYRGRVFGISSLQWEDLMDSIEVVDKVLTIKCDVEVLKSSRVDQLTGETTNFLNIVPKLGVALADI